VAEPTAVLHRMVKDTEITFADTKVLSGVTQFLDSQPKSNIRTVSIYNALKEPDALKGIGEENRAGVVDQLKILQRVQAISPVPEAIPVLMNAHLTTAFHVGEIPESAFLSAHSEALGGEDIAKQVYTNAINNRIRNEQALMILHENVRGVRMAAIDGDTPMETRMARFQKMADEQQVPLNLETLFGNIDYCECDECQSVYSPASYFVELLQYLRNNNLDPKKPNTGVKGIDNTPLEKLFRRRPDLGCLELTCENTFTVLPYIDLVNEVMESFVVHLGEYVASTDKPKQATLEAFNVEDETTSELLAQPQHTNYEAYCILKSAVYPFTLPYHQPIDATRIFLNYLATSRYELLDTYRTAHEKCPNTSLSPAELEELQTIHGVVQDRAVDAEYLGMTQEEYIILTKEAFWPKRYFEVTQKTTIADQKYWDEIGVREVHEYYGYDKDKKADMLDTVESKQLGLTFVKKQFLKRTGIQYTDLVELLKTRFINPNFPQRKALTILESIRFSYRFLQTLVVPGNDPTTRFAKLVEFLEQTQTFLPLLDAILHPDPCHKDKVDTCTETKDLKNWVHCYFDRIGKLIVLDSGEGPRLPIVGPLFTERFTDGFQPEFVGTLRKDGIIVERMERPLGM
jgi:Salmonella virulence plasmid 28.1kDa A protein